MDENLEEKSIQDLREYKVFLMDNLKHYKRLAHKVDKITKKKLQSLYSK